MKTYRVFLIILALATYSLANASIFDTEVVKIPTMEEYASDLSTLDITYTQPEGFKPVKLDEYFGLQYDKRWKGQDNGFLWAYSMILEADNEQGALLYPVIAADKPMIDFAVKIQAELSKSPDIDISPLLTFVADEDMSQYANADTAVFFSFDIGGPVLDKYPHIIGILLRKYAHQTMYLKIALSDEGLNNADEFIKALLGSLKYGTYNSEKLVERERINMPDFDLKFPKPREGSGIYPSVMQYINSAQNRNERRFVDTPKVYISNDIETKFRKVFNDLNNFKNYTIKDYDVVIKAPGGYEEFKAPSNIRSFVIKELPEYPDASNVKMVSYHPLTYRSDDDNAILLFPYLKLTAQTLGDTPEKEAKVLSADTTLTVFRELTPDEAFMMCNADSGYIYEVPLKWKYLGKYQYCIGIFFEKYAHPLLRMKILLTEDGYKEKEKHINALISCFYYGNILSETALKERARQNLDKQ